MVSMPLALIASAFFTKPGRWFLWQVGVKAPGTANSTTFLPLKISSVVFGFGPSAVITVKVAVRHAIADLDSHDSYPLAGLWDFDYGRSN